MQVRVRRGGYRVVGVTSDTRALALGLRRRDVALLHALVGEYQSGLHRYLTCVLGRREGVDDLVQETWLRVLERGSSYNGRSRFEPWLFTIARRLAVDRMRRRRDASLDSDEQEGSVGADAHACGGPSPFVLAARTEDARRVARAMETLEAVSREALVLRFHEELSLEEISAVVGAPVSTVASRIYRGLAAMRVELGGRDAD